jgi:hypothetical protein
MRWYGRRRSAVRARHGRRRPDPALRPVHPVPVRPRPARVRRPDQVHPGHHVPAGTTRSASPRAPVRALRAPDGPARPGRRGRTRPRCRPGRTRLRSAVRGLTRPRCRPSGPADRVGLAAVVRVGPVGPLVRVVPAAARVSVAVRLEPAGRPARLAAVSAVVPAVAPVVVAPVVGTAVVRAVAPVAAATAVVRAAAVVPVRASGVVPAVARALRPVAALAVPVVAAVVAVRVVPVARSGAAAASPRVASRSGRSARSSTTCPRRR